MQPKILDGDRSSTSPMAAFAFSRRTPRARVADRPPQFGPGHSPARLHPSAVIGVSRAQLSPGPVPRRKIRHPDAPSFVRERLLRLLHDAARQRVVLVAAPPGFGKTALLAQFASRVTHPVAWYRAEAMDASTDALVHHVSCALTTEVADLEGRWSDVDALIHALESWEGDRLTLVIDDLHTLTGTAAEQAVARLATYLPAHVTLLLGTRTVPSFDVSRLRVSGELLDIGPEELRFRSGEAERLFREAYEQPLPAEELAELVRRTQGWPAALRLFHLATQGKPGAERRKVLASLQGGSKLVREYLTRNLLDELPPRIRDFLLQTSVLGVVTATLCDQLRDATDSGELLVELEKRRLFTSRLEDGGVYRYHGILRSHLVGILTLTAGRDAARALHRRAGELLHQAGEPGSALEAYAQAEEWDAAARLLAREGQALARDASSWMLSLPSSLVEGDPWLQLAAARRHLAAGAWESAVRAYTRSEELFRGADPAEVARRERRNLEAWSGAGPAGDDWAGVLLQAVQGRPVEAASDVTDADPRRLLARGVALLLAGEVREAEADLRALAQDKDVDPALATATDLAAGIAGMLGQTDGAPARLLDAVETCERLQYTWLAHLGRAALLLDPAAQQRQGQPSPVPGGGAGQRWRQAVAALFAGLGALHDQDGEAGPSQRRLHEAAGWLESSAEAFQQLQAATLEGWARAALAIAQARTSSPRARWTLRIAERLATDSRARGVEALVAAAAVELDGERGDGLRAKAAALAQRTGLAMPGVGPGVGSDDLGPQAPKTTAQEAARMGGRTLPTGVRPRRERSIAAGAGRIQVTAPHIRAGRRAATAVGDAVQPREARHEAGLVLRCFGEFSLEIRGAHVEESAVKPRVRSLLHLLALHAGRPVHRETLIEALWPEADLRSGTRNLHVALSSLRQLFEPGVPRGASSLLVREGDSYRLALPPDADVDLLRFERAFGEGRAARAAGDRERSVRAFTGTLQAYGGELLPSEGPVEWVVKERERYRMIAADAAEGLAEALLGLGDPAGAGAACERGLTIDRYRDRLWRLLADARQQSGDPAAAAQARRNYREMLLELGLQHPEF